MNHIDYTFVSHGNDAQHSGHSMQHTPQQALYGNFQIKTKREQGRPRTNWSSVISEDIQKMSLTADEAKWQLLTDNNVVTE